MKVEPVRGGLTLWWVRRALLDTIWLIRQERTRLALRPLPRRSPRWGPTVRGPWVDVCDCQCEEPLSLPPKPERPRLELDWPSDNAHPKETIIVRTVTRYETDKIAESMFDLFI